MSKSIKILSIISVIFSCVGILIAIAILTFLWEPINILFNSPDVITEANPIIPIGTMMHIVSSIIVAIVLLVSCKSKKLILIEILSIVFLSMVLPVMIYRIDMTQTIFVGHTMGNNALSVMNVGNSYMVFSLGFVNLSISLCLITSGMRIAEKVIENKNNSIK